MGMKRKASMHTPSVKADWSDSMEMIIQLAKKSVIRICHVLKQNTGWQIADEINDPYIKSTVVSKLEIHFMTIHFLRTYAGLVRFSNAINLITLFPPI